MTHPDAFRGTELDVEPNRQKMEKLVTRVEGFMNEAAPAPANSSQALADMLREALASNTIGGRAGEESKWRTMAEDVRQAQAAWSRLGPVPGDTGRALNERFHRAVTRFFDQYRRKVRRRSRPRSGSASPWGRASSTDSRPVRALLQQGQEVRRVRFERRNSVLSLLRASCSELLRAAARDY